MRPHEPRRRRRLALLLVLVGAALSLVSVATASRLTQGGFAVRSVDRNGVLSGAARLDGFLVTGQVRDLTPVGGVLVVDITNPNARAIRVQSIAVEAEGARGDCPDGALTVLPLRAPVDVAAGRDASTELVVRLLDDDDCQGGRWALSFRASGMAL